MQEIKKKLCINMSYWKIYILLICLFIAIYGLILTQNHFLDDTFIHLRIASNILEKGFYSFNGIERDFSTSSPLYTGILSLGLSFWDSPYLAKFINIFAFILIFILVSAKLIKSKDLEAFITSIFLIGISSPLGIRWLTDGMESSIVMLCSLCSSYFLISFFSLKNFRNGVAYSFLISIFFFSSILLRIEFSFLLFWFSISFLISKFLSKEDLNIKIIINKFLPLFLSIICAFGFIYFVFGSFTPDTSIAKSGLNYSFYFLFKNIARAHISASIFGLSLLINWLLSIYLLFGNSKKIKNDNTKFYYFIGFFMNLSFPVMISLIFFKGQMIQGIRYFIFIESFLISFNLFVYKKSINNNFLRTNYPHNHSKEIKKYISILFLCLTISPLFWNDFSVLKKISSGRSETFLKFSRKDFSCLNNSNLLAWDVGMIGYYSKSKILDPNGLVNGRKIAKLDKNIRLENLLNKREINYAFVNRSQIQELESYLDFSDWEEIDTYKFPNFKKDSEDIHYLLASPNLKKCDSIKLQ